MKRTERYPETPYFHYYNANPKNRLTTDCVIRAISTATEIDYNTVLQELVKVQIKTGYDFAEVRCYGAYLESLGWVKHKQPRKADGTKYTGKQFLCIDNCSLNSNKRYVANIGGNHVVAIVNGKVYDIWDSTNGCIGNYWSKD